MQKTSEGVNENKGLKKMPTFKTGEPITPAKVNEIIQASNDVFADIINGQLFKPVIQSSGGGGDGTVIYRTVNNKDDAKSSGGVEVKKIDSSSADTGSSLFKNKFTPYPTTEGDYVCDTNIEEVEDPDVVSVIGRNADTPLKTIDHSTPTDTWNRSIHGTALAIDDIGLLLVLATGVRTVNGTSPLERRLLTREFSWDKHGHLFKISTPTQTTIARTA